MKKVKEYISVEETFQYENIGEKLQHEEVMIMRGYSVKPFLAHLDNNLQVDYRKTDCRYIDYKLINKRRWFMF